MDEEKANVIAKWWTPGLYWTSGDYSAATDNLKGEVSYYLLKKILDRSGLFTEDPLLYEQAIRSFLNSEVIYDEKVIPNYSGISELGPDIRELDSFMQTNGQLMGHVLSFPILCLANYISYVLSVEEMKKREVSFEEIVTEHPLRINGDDILFCSTREFREIWMKTITLFGFEPSQGKKLH